MVEPLRHRQTKEAATDMFYLTPPRHISTLHIASVIAARYFGSYQGQTGRNADIAKLKRWNTRHRSMKNRANLVADAA
jgi:hypothetical protein